MSVGRKIHQLRLESRITQRELGEVTGLAVSYLSRVEKGDKELLRTLLTILTGLLALKQGANGDSKSKAIGAK